MKKKIIITVVVLLLIAILLFAVFCFIFIRGLGEAIQVAGNEIVNNVAEGVAEGIIEGGIEIAGDLYEEGFSTFLGGIK